MLKIIKLLLPRLFIYLARLKYPTLFKISAGLLLLTFLIPNPIPFLDEILLTVITLAISSRKKSKDLELNKNNFDKSNISNNKIIDSEVITIKKD